MWHICILNQTSAYADFVWIRFSCLCTRYADGLCGCGMMFLLVETEGKSAYYQLRLRLTDVFNSAVAD